MYSGYSLIYCTSQDLNTLAALVLLWYSHSAHLNIETSILSKLWVLLGSDNLQSSCNRNFTSQEKEEEEEGNDNKEDDNEEGEEG